MKVFAVLYRPSGENRRAHAETAEIPITTPSFWVDEAACPDSLLRHVFRSATDENMPLMQERIGCLREAGRVLCKVWIIGLVLRRLLNWFPSRISTAASQIASITPTTRPRPSSIYWQRASPAFGTRRHSRAGESDCTSERRSSSLTCGPASTEKATESSMTLRRSPCLQVCIRRLYIP